MGSNKKEPNHWYDKLAGFILAFIGYRSSSSDNKHPVVFFFQIALSTAYFGISVWALIDYSLFALALSSLLSAQIIVHLIQVWLDEEEEIVEYVKENNLDESISVTVPGKRRITLYAVISVIALVSAFFVIILTTGQKGHLIMMTICFIVYCTSYLDQLIAIVIECYETNLIIQG